MQKLLTIVVPFYKVDPYINNTFTHVHYIKTDWKGVRVLDDFFSIG